MPASTSPQAASASTDPAAEFPPITRDHILNCSYDSWFPKYRASCIKSRIIPLSPEFLEYIREDGIILADDDEAEPEDDEWESSNVRPHVVEEVDTDSDTDSESDEDEPPKLPPNQRFPDIHKTIIDKIAELGGAVAPKLNWTAPKDAVWISPHQNTIKCTSPNDIYLLLKSSNFITYDLEHAFDDCTPTAASSNSASPPSFKPVLVLRSYFNIHTAMEFRCFVKHRNIIAISQRDLNHFDFLDSLRDAILARVFQLFNHKLRYTFPDGSFVFDVYLPELDADGADKDVDDKTKQPLARARLIDINPWAPHTDSLLFDWRELLAFETPGPMLGVVADDPSLQEDGEEDEGSDDDAESSDDELDVVPELRLVAKEDSTAYNFSSPQYSAHKLPKDVVDASLAGEGGMRDFAQKWREMTEYRANVAEGEKKVNN
ncbi:D123-domain-containing protein [Xylariomycetidae sp. FL0641]|nr:D123-domain-containing protein [Xylariomycetidae sp. FL0641]